ncbi:hypothetical protein DL95DRAFT_491012 [Leptodontidium sp. 2 PMI_412]|nr:hypothetical protein DL95DRAFT_491012 [Leptodontidium sp. 2 PMI_412]
MQDSANPDCLYASFLDINQRNNHLAEQVDILERRFVDLSSHLTGEFRLFQESVRTEFQAIKMGSTFTAIIESQDCELAQLREQTGTLRKEREQTCHEKRQLELAYKDLTDKFDAAEQRAEALDFSCDESARQVKKLQSQIEKLESENEAMLLGLKSADDEKQRLEGQAVVLRGVITKNRGLNGTQVDDNTIATSFMKLRDQIQAIATKLCSGKSDKDCFGLENLGENSEVERGLKNFESAMNKISQGHEDDVAEWRTQTMRCASFLQLESTMPGQTVGAIRHFFAPLWPQPPTEDKLHALVTQLCKDAFSLAMLLRSCKDVYQCEFPPPRSMLTEDTEPQERELRQEDMSDGLTDQDIAYNLSGMLVKYPKQDAEKRLVLVKAHVIVY